MPTKIKEINIQKIKNRKGVVAIVGCVIEAEDKFSLYLEKIAVVTNFDGEYRLSFPWSDFGGQKVNVFHPVNNKTKEILEESIIGRYKRLEESYHRGIGDKDDA